MANGKETFDELKTQMYDFIENGVKFYTMDNKNAAQRARVALNTITKLSVQWKLASLHGDSAYRDGKYIVKDGKRVSK